MRTKYKMSNGLAFSEAKDMAMLRSKALKGWRLKRFACAGYRFEKGEVEDVIFSIDYRTLEPGEEEEYFELFSQAGWTHVCTEYGMHIFKADRGTVPIYSDADSKRDKIARQAIPVQAMAVYSIGFSLITLLVMAFTSGLINTISSYAFAFSMILTIPAVMTLMATYYHRVKQNK